MNIAPNAVLKKNHLVPAVAVSRLTALWALHEAGLGGILHLFNTPFGGIFMAGFATILITLIAYFAERKSSIILKSIILVIIAKIIASPHSGALAYMAVIVQGLFGIFVFKYVRSLRVASMLLGIFALTESALQLVFVTVFIFGKSLLTSIDIFTSQIGESLGFVFENGSLVIMGGYVLLYFLLGILFGDFAYYIVKNLKRTILEEYHDTMIDDNFIVFQQIDIKNKSQRVTNRNVFAETLLIGGGIAAVLIFLSPQSNGWQTMFYVLIRCISFMILWFFIINPLLTRGFKKYFEKKHKKYQPEIDDIFEFMNTLRKLAIISWQETQRFRGIKRIRQFIQRTIAYALLYEANSQ